MLEQLAVSFKVIGKGIAELNKAKVKIEEIKHKMKSPFHFKGLEKGLNYVKPKLRKFGDYATRQFERAQQKASKFGGILKRIAGILVAGFTIKMGITEAAQIEKYRNTLETVLKDPNAARQKLAWANRFANKTPFETDEVVGGMTKLQSYGIEGDRILKTTKRTYLEMIGDMASGMGKSFDQAIEAVADAKTGELERLKEFGITKQMLADFGKEKGLDLFNNKGQIKDMELFNKTLFEMMDSRFGGAMQKQAKTFNGALSTIKGGLKSALSTLMGINEFGDIIENSPFQILKDKVLLPFSNYVVKLQENGTFTKWAESVGKAVSKFVGIVTKVIDFAIKWKEVIIPLIGALAGLFVLNKIVVLIGAMKVALAALSFNPVILAIGAVIAIGIALYRNWDKIKEKLSAFWGRVKDFTSAIWKVGKKMFFLFTPFGVFIRIGVAIVKNWQLIKEKLVSFWEKLKSFASYLWEFGKSIFMIFSPIGWVIQLGKLLISNWDVIKEKFAQIGNFLLEKLSGVWETLKSTTTSAFDFVLGYVEQIWEKIKGFFSGLGSKIKSLPGISLFFKGEGGEATTENLAIHGSHATGLDYVPFDGYIAELHKGERVLTKEENQNLSNNSTYSNTSNKANTKKNLEIHIHVGQVGADIDWCRVGEMVAEAIERKEMEKDIAEGVV